MNGSGRAAFCWLSTRPVNLAFRQRDPARVIALRQVWVGLIFTGPDRVNRTAYDLVRFSRARVLPCTVVPRLTGLHLARLLFLSLSLFQLSFPQNPNPKPKTLISFSLLQVQVEIKSYSFVLTPITVMNVSPPLSIDVISRSSCHLHCLGDLLVL